jgi:plastocyanin
MGLGLGLGLLSTLADASCAQQFSVTGKVELFVEGSALPEDSSGAIVWLTRIGEPDKAPIPTDERKQQFVQRNKSFSPHIAIVQVGSPVAFPNRDPFFHNVFSLFEGKRFDLGLYEAGSSRSVVFDREGISYIFCNIHPGMSGVVVALKTPYHGISDSRGLVTLPGVPPGRYEVHVWHERAIPSVLNTQVRTISISESLRSFGVLRVVAQRGFLPAHKNKYGQDYDPPAPDLPVYPHP